MPKCIVHGAGGTLLQHLKELMLHTDLKESDTIFYFTTCGWMMWNWFVSSLAVGATLILYDGSPFHPHPGAMFDLIDEEQVTVYGTGAKYIASVEKQGLRPMQTHRLTSLRTILSTASPLLPEHFAFVYQHIKSDLCLASISGGTDIISCFALGNPILPVYSGELQCRGLGMQVEIFDAQGRALHDAKGELVCSAPFPSMPIYFWQDPENKKYQQAYFSKYPNVWAHGDFAELTAHGGLIIYGRSDAVLNPGGIRIGTAEIYREVEKIDAVLESIAVDQEWNDDTRIILFVKLRAGLLLDVALIEEIKTNIRQQLSPRHVPAKIIQVADIPKTINGKLVELAVRNVIHHQPVKNIDAIANPQALDFFRDIVELKN
jgi:acetoacetyl-CoA synthetase